MHELWARVVQAQRASIVGKGRLGRSIEPLDGAAPEIGLGKAGVIGDGVGKVLVGAAQLPKLQIRHTAADIGFRLELRWQHIEPQGVGIVGNRVPCEASLLLGNAPLAISNRQRLAGEGAFL